MTICACLIVKNEAKTIERCLASLYGRVSCVVLCDTGSTDGTIAIAGSAAKRPTLIARSVEWIDFATNRNNSMELGRQQGADWLLIPDADQEFAGEVGPLDPAVDAYSLEVHGEGVRHPSPLLLRADADCRYAGKAHEAVDLTGKVVRPMPSLWIVHHADGGDRNAEGWNPRWERDIRELEKDRSPRAAFHLARTYEQMAHHCPPDDARGEAYRWAAISAYAKRAEMGGNQDEVYLSLTAEGQLTKRQHERMGLLLQAWAICPTRWEAAYHLCCELRAAEAWETVYAITRACLDLGPAPSGSFLDIEIHDRLMMVMHLDAAAVVGAPAVVAGRKTGGGPTSVGSVQVRTQAEQSPTALSG